MHCLFLYTNLTLIFSDVEFFQKIPPGKVEGLESPEADLERNRHGDMRHQVRGGLTLGKDVPGFTLGGSDVVTRLVTRVGP